MNYNLKHYAYIGDCVWELFIREIIITKTQKQDVMHKMSTKFVNAQAQADILEKIIENLTPEELEVQKRGRNLKITINKNELCKKIYNIINKKIISEKWQLQLFPLDYVSKNNTTSDNQKELLENKIKQQLMHLLNHNL